MKTTKILGVLVALITIFSAIESFAQSCTSSFQFNVEGPTMVCADGVTQHSYTGSGANLTWYIDGGSFVNGNYGGGVTVVWTTTTYGSIWASGMESGPCNYDEASGETICEYYCYSGGTSVVPIISQINGPSFFCAGASVTLYCSFPDYTYQWKRNSIAISGATDVSYVATQGGTYTVVLNNGICLKESDPFVLTEYTNPPALTVASASNQLIPGSTALTASSGANYQWKKDGLPIQGGTDQNYIAVMPGTYSVSTSESHGCATNSAGVNVSSNNNQNFTVMTSVLIPGIITETQLLGQPISDGANTGYLSQSISYTDQQGKTNQSILRQASPAHLDVLHQAQYDELNRQKRAYLPIIVNQGTGMPVANILVNPGTGNYSGSPHYDFYNVSSALNDKVAKDTAPFGERVFDGSPLNLIRDQGSTGSKWQPTSTNSYTSFSYGTNAISEVYRWTINASTGLPEAAGYWPAAALAKQTITEQVPTASEPDPYMESFTDMIGLKIMDRTQKGSSWITNYYVYDSKNNLRYVLTASLLDELGSGSSLYPTADQINRWAYQSEYDILNRKIKDKTPGAGWSYCVYDKLDRIVLSQDANQTLLGQWKFTKYDQFDRPVITGLYTSGTLVTRDDLQNTVNALNSGKGYQYVTLISESVNEAKGGVDIVSTAYDGYREYTPTNSIRLQPGFTFAASATNSFRGSIGSASSLVQGADVFPTTSIENLGMIYYDNYKGNDQLFLDPDLQFVNVTWQTSSNEVWQRSNRVQDKLTGSSTKILGTTKWLNSIIYYDRKGRILQTVSSTHLNATIRESNLYDFSGKILETQSMNSATYTIAFQGLINTTMSGSNLNKTPLTNAWDAGASSVQTLQASTDGYIETTITSVAPVLIMGMSDADTDILNTSIDFGFKMNGNILEVHENGVSKFVGSTGSLAIGDVLRIQRQGTTILYLKNDKLVYISATPSSSVLMADISIYSSGGSLSAVRASFSSQGITFLNGTRMVKRIQYDHTGRMLKAWHRINLQPEVLLSSHEYNAIGEEIDKKIHSTDNGTSWLQSIDYRYSVKGWLTSINGVSVPDASETDYFAAEYAYDQPFISGSTNGRFDGNISSIKWKNDISTKERLYSFEYDQVKRLKNSNYKARATTADAVWLMHNDRYTEKITDYDPNGNISGLLRYKENGTNKIDELTYEYGSTKSNRLLKVTDSAPVTTASIGFVDGNTSGDDYDYDAVGNLKHDLNKGIVLIRYNHLNLPKVVRFINNDSINYEYDASGMRLSEIYFKSGQQIYRKDYSGGMVYLNNEISFIQHEEGRLVPPDYQNLVENKEANGTEGFTASGSVTLTSETLLGETYVKAVCNQTTGTPGIFPIGGTYAVKAGEKYSFKILGYRETSAAAYLKVTGNGSPANIVWTGALLPQGSANQNWVTTEFIIPVGVTQIQIGVQWSAPALNEIFFINRVALYKVDWEYQYFLTDHQGNARVVLGTTPSSVTVGATFETEAATTENSKFLNINYSNVVVNLPANATPGGNEVIRMNNTYRVGPARSMKVFPGDKIDASVKAYYTSASGFTQAPLTTIVTAVANVLVGGNSTIATEISNAYTNSNAGNGNLLLAPYQGSSKPSAFLNYILFDEEYKVLEAKSTAIGSANVLHQLVLPQVSVKELGYLFVYLSYDNESANWVYFDELKVTQQESPVMQVTSYYPFGMTAYEWVREGEKDNQFNYQGKEYDSLTQWHDFHARQYDASIGRFTSQDPASQFASPFTGMGNNPINGTDPSGKFFGIDDLIVTVVGFVYGYVSYGIMNNDWGKNALKSGAINAALFELSYLTAGGGLTAAGGATQVTATTVGTSVVEVQVTSATVAATVRNAGTFLLNSAISTAASSILPSETIYNNNVISITISPALSMKGIGVNMTASMKLGDITVSRGFGVSSQYAGGTLYRMGGSVSYFNGNVGTGYATTDFWGVHDQRIGEMSFRWWKGDMGFKFSNDVFPEPYADGGDRFRTAAGELSYKEYSIGVMLHTGDPDVPYEGPPGGKQTYRPQEPNCDAKAGAEYSSAGARDKSLRAGIAYVGYKNYRFGWNSDRIRHGVQNVFVHDFFIRLFSREYSNYFNTYSKTELPGMPYFNVNGGDKFSIWGLE